MNADIDPVHSTPAGSTAQPQTAGARNAPPSGVFGAALAKAQKAGVEPATEVPPSPPPELAANIAAAARAWEALAAGGQHVAFGDPAEGRFTIELQDPHGAGSRTLTGAQLFELIDEQRGR